ncbi:MAG: protein-glutamate O-methyltransferase family protein [Oscillatoriales cyanobacterium C42_A2020_001]|nr:protein-glutamate O-methyltransferase family protein [Leptolyngbyaceae cyanobacterium C42_A2020_001]
MISLSSKQPRLPLPSPLMMSEPGSFAYFTMHDRWTTIARRIIPENQYPPEIAANLEALVKELLHGNVRSLNDDGGTDVATWNANLQPFLGKSWIEMPWFFAEVYFYRRILEATQFFGKGQWQGVDPFAVQKQRELEAICSNPAISIAADSQGNPKQFISRLYQSLWGNRADLSLKPGETLTSAREIEFRNSQHILVDDAPAIAAMLAKKACTRIDLIGDNAGFELFYDLQLIEFLLTTQTTQQVFLHLKAHPTFVSDATIQDARTLLDTFAKNEEIYLQSWANLLKNYLKEERLILGADEFWTSPFAFWQMPDTLYQEFAKSHLIVIKGDANYRRILGDRQWSFTTPFSEIASYFPAPLAALRTLKSEIVAGLQTAQIQQLNNEDSAWLTNGDWGLIQFVDHKQSEEVP